MHVSCRREYLSASSESLTEAVPELGFASVEGRDQLRRLGIDLRQDMGVDVQREGHGRMPPASRTMAEFTPLARARLA